MTFCWPESIACCSTGLCGGTETRRNIDTPSSAAPIGGWPRPSFRWQFWQPRELNSGPRPSDACVDDGDETQTLVKKRLPRLNRSWSSKLRLAENCEKTSRLISFLVVAAPPGSSSKFSGLLK